MPRRTKIRITANIPCAILAFFLTCALLCSCREYASGSQNNPTSENNSTLASTKYTNTDSPADTKNVTQPSQQETRIPEEDVFDTEPDKESSLPTEGAPTTPSTQGPTVATNPTTPSTQGSSAATNPTTLSTQGSTVATNPTTPPPQESTEGNGPIILPVLPP